MLVTETFRSVPLGTNIHNLLCISSCLPWKLPEVSHHTNIHNLLCISSCSPRKLPEVSHQVPIFYTTFSAFPSWNLPEVSHQVLIYTTFSAFPHACHGNFQKCPTRYQYTQPYLPPACHGIFLKCPTRYQFTQPSLPPACHGNFQKCPTKYQFFTQPLALTHTCSCSVPPGTSIPNFLLHYASTSFWALLQFEFFS